MPRRNRASRPTAAPSDVELLPLLVLPLEHDLVELFADDAAVQGLRETGAQVVDRDAEIIFRGASGVVLGPFRGTDGLVTGWREWLSTFASYRISLEDVFQHGDRVVSLVRQTGRTVHDDVPVPSPPSAAVWTVRDGRIARVVFYLDRAEAAEAEGFELP